MTLSDLTLDLFGTVPDSIVDGPGLRYAVFVQGCSHGCPGCHNPESQPCEGGKATLISDIIADIETNELCHDVTISGGEPFEQAEGCAALARELKDAGYGVWTYTGYLYEDLLRSDRAGVSDLLAFTDVLVDGPFIQGQRSLELDWRGSANQRLIDLPATRKAGKVVEWKQPSFDLTIPESW